MEALISVIIPVYKVECYLDKCIKSVTEQQYKNLEIILVDDGSPDDCPNICDKWAKRDKRIKVVHKSNGGLSDARNVGIQMAKGDFISFVDSDDWISPQMYEKMLQILQKEHADVCACNIISHYEDHEEMWGCKKYVAGNPEKILNMLYDETTYPVAAWNKLYRRECWENVRFPIGKICEDAFTTYKIVHSAKKIVQIPEALYYYRIRPQSIMTSNFSTKRMDEEEAWRMNYQFIKKHYPQLYKKAYRFYVQKVHVLIQAISEDQRNEFLKEFEYLKGIMKQNLLFIMLKSGLNWKYRIKYLIDYFQL